MALFLTLGLIKQSNTLNRQWGSNAYAPISNDTKAHTQHLFQHPLLTWLYLFQNLSEEGLWKHAQPIGCTQEAPQLRTRITQTNISNFRLILHGSQVFPNSIGYHSHDLVHSTGKKPSSTGCDSPCRADTPTERSNEVAGKVISSRVRHVASAVSVSY